MNHHDAIVKIQYKRIFIERNDGLYLKSPTISYEK